MELQLFKMKYMINISTLLSQLLLVAVQVNNAVITNPRQSL
jgi:hypothetical protein